MTDESLKFINDELSPIIEYQFCDWTTNPVPDPYFVGEYTEIESTTLEECGYQETSFLLTGTGTSWFELEQKKRLIKNILPKTAILPNGDGIAVFYNNSIPVPTGNEKYKRIQINLIVKEWMVN